MMRIALLQDILEYAVEHMFGKLMRQPMLIQTLIQILIQMMIPLPLLSGGAYLMRARTPTDLTLEDNM